MRTAADLIIENVSLWPGFGAERIADGAAAVRDGIIVFSGARRDAASWRDSATTVIDGGSGLLLPSFSDLHTHFLLGSLGELEIDLRGVAGRDEFRARVRSALGGLRPGEWLTGGYWNEEDWLADGAPDRTWLDDIAPDNPLLLHRHDLHQALANTRALEKAGFLAPCADPAGGRIVRRSDGSPTGILLERAVTLVRQVMPPPDRERRRAALAAGMSKVNALGLTAISDMIDGPEDLDLYLEMARAGELTCRFELLMPLPLRRLLIDAGLRSGAGFDLVRLGPMKGFMDGSLGSRTALMLEAYADNPDNCGHLLEMADPPEKIGGMMAEALAAGFSTAVHAIGDRANRILLDLYAGLPIAGTRCRVEHAQHLDPSDIGRFARQGLVVSMQPIHLVDDARFAETALGRARVNTSYAIRSLIDSGAVVVFGSDWPVASIDPLAGIDAAVNRRSSDGAFPGGWLPHEKISVAEALRGYTEAAAWARGEERSLGRLEPGFSADLVILDTDLFAIPPGEILSARVTRTFLRGRQVHPE
jgi:predicted amidohydrolase YtcJ